MMIMEAPLPVQDDTSKPFFEGIAEGRLLLQRDPETGKAQFYPRPHVIAAPERVPEWFEASGRGTLHSFTVVQRSAHPEFAEFCPFVIALVDLEEGVRVTSWVVDVPEEDLACDMALRVVFRELRTGLTMPCFTAE